MSEGFWDIPCVECIVYAACRSKEVIECEILYKHYIKKFPDVWIKVSPGSRAQRNDYLVFLNKMSCSIVRTRECMILYGD
jgi:hypothetical protein